MNTITRRTFGKRVLAAGILPLITPQAQQQTETIAPPLVPQIIAGYKPTTEEKLLAEKYLSAHEKNLSSVRPRDLPNSLAPYFVITSPTMDAKRGESLQ